MVSHSRVNKGFALSGFLPNRQDSKPLGQTQGTLALYSAGRHNDSRIGAEFTLNMTMSAAKMPRQVKTCRVAEGEVEY
jgi:hypothetical protein